MARGWSLASQRAGEFPGDGCANLEDVSPWREIAAANTAGWCDAVCRTHGIVTATDAVAWTSLTRSPALYPDAVTLAPDVSVDELLARIDRSQGCSIKDSFASLNLAGYGFRILFDGQWIVRQRAKPLVVELGPRWTVVKGADAFVSWESAWRSHDGPFDVLRPGLLSLASVTILAAVRNDRVVAGAIVNCSSEVIGISYFFTEDDTVADNWRSCLAFVDSLFPGATLVGYESGIDLLVVRTIGFAAAGPMRVWVS